MNYYAGHIYLKTPVLPKSREKCKVLLSDPAADVYCP